MSYGTRFALPPALLAVLLAAALCQGRAAMAEGRLARGLERLSHPVQLTRSAMSALWAIKTRRDTPDLVVLGDMHVGEGRLDKTGKVSPRESFQMDQELARMTDYLMRRQARAGRRLELVLAGDTFDFLKVTQPPRGESWPGDDPGLHSSPDERTAELKVRRIIQQHPKFFESVGQLLAAGHRVVFIAGNHDQEINFGKVKARLVEELRRRGGRQVKAGQVEFKSWIHVQGKVLMEHGHRYDSINNLDHMLFPFTPGTDGSQRLRAPAGNYMVTNVVNHMLQKVPGFDQLQPKLVSLLRLTAHLPSVLKRFVALAKNIADRAGPLPAQTASAIRALHEQALESEAQVLRKALNKQRRCSAQGALGKREALGLARELDKLVPRAYLHELDLKGGRLKRVLKVLGQTRRWTRYLSLHNTLSEGQRFTLEKLGLDVHVSGHSHVPDHQVASTAGRQTHLVNFGSWTGRPGRRGLDRPAGLSFVDIRQKHKVPTVRLRRWDVSKGRPVLLGRH